MVTVAEIESFREFVIIQRILGAQNKADLLVLAELLMNVPIARNHQEIRDAFKKMALAVGLASNAHTYHMVLLALWNQEQRAMREQVAV